MSNSNKKINTNTNIKTNINTNINKNRKYENIKKDRDILLDKLLNMNKNLNNSNRDKSNIKLNNAIIKLLSEQNDILFENQKKIKLILDNYYKILQNFNDESIRFDRLKEIVNIIKNNTSNPYNTPNPYKV